MKVLVAGLILFGMGLIPPTANADPIKPSCFDPRLCGDLGSVQYCPSTGSMVGPFTPCPALVTGPYAPGGLQPNKGLEP